MMVPVAPWHFILAVLAGWVHKEQLKVIEYLQAENRALREKLGNKRIRFTDEQRRRLAVKGHALGRKALRELDPIVTPDTILRWYRELVAKKYDGSQQRAHAARRCAASAISSSLRKRRSGLAGNTGASPICYAHDSRLMLMWRRPIRAGVGSWAIRAVPLFSMQESIGFAVHGGGYNSN